MSIVISYGDQEKEYFLNPIGNVGNNSGSTTNASGLYLVDGRVLDENGNDVTEELDSVLASNVSVGDMLIEYEETEETEEV